MSLAWDEIRARSEAQTTSGLTVFCGNCDLAFKCSGLPCRKHATLAERKAIDEHLREALITISLAESPVANLLRRRP